MRLRTRLLLALGFLALFALVPAAAAPADRAWQAQLRVREWLLAAEGPLAAWRVDGTLPPLVVDLRQSPPLVDPEERQRREAEYARCAREWAAARTADRLPTRVDPARGELPLQVRVGSDGLQAVLPQPDGAPATLLLPFASRWSLLPALVAIVLAVLTQRVLLALLAGCLAGAVVVAGSALPGQPLAALAALGLTAPLGPGEAVLAGSWHLAADALGRRTLCEDFYLRITLFVVFLFMTVGVITRNGGVHGLVAVMQRRVRGPVGAQLASFAAGLVVFFDDYTNCLLVGSSMRPLCDASRVSRAKLAYLVDSTAAPVAGLSVFSTWVVYEMSTYRGPLALVTKPDGTPYVPDDAFAVFLATVPFRCYCLFTLALVALVILLRRDLGPMLAAERRARAGLAAAGDGHAAADAAGMPGPRPGTPHRARNAIAPLLLLVGGTVVGMLAFGWHATRDQEFTGWPEHLQAVLARSRSDLALLLASLAALALACAQTLRQRLLAPRELLRTLLRATRTLWLAFGILFLAWTLGHVCSDLGTAFHLTTAARGAMTAAALPAVLFVVAGAMAFATGTSFGTMAILLPNVVVLAHQLGTDAAFTGSAAAGGPALLLLCIGAVLEGAIFGDHCSPISDTTVLSALGTQCPLLEHVTTQLPYALLAAAVSLLCGYLPLALLGPHVWPWSLLAGVLAMAAWLWWFGRDPERPAAHDGA